MLVIIDVRKIRPSYNETVLNIFKYIYVHIHNLSNIIQHLFFYCFILIERVLGLHKHKQKSHFRDPVYFSHELLARF